MYNVTKFNSTFLILDENGTTVVGWCDGKTDDSPFSYRPIDFRATQFLTSSLSENSLATFEVPQIPSDGIVAYTVLKALYEDNGAKIINEKIIREAGDGSKLSFNVSGQRWDLVKAETDTGYCRDDVWVYTQDGVLTTSDDILNNINNRAWALIEKDIKTNA